MPSEFNLKDLLKDLFIGFLILSPVFVLSVAVVNPAEQAAKREDIAKKDKINVFARAIEPLFKQEGVFPQSLDVLEFSTNDYAYKVSEDGRMMIIYTKARSLAWREYCHNQETFIVYSSIDNRTALVCSPPSPGHQKFVN